MSESAIDLDHLARQCGGDHALERELLALFAEQCLRHEDTIRTSGDARARLDAAHTLKGAARAIGAWRIADAADAIERSLESADAAGTAEAVSALALAAGTARTEISRLGAAA